MVTGGILYAGSVLLNVGLPCHCFWKAFLFRNLIGAKKNTSDNVPYSFLHYGLLPIFGWAIYGLQLFDLSRKIFKQEMVGRVCLAPFLMNKSRGTSAPHLLSAEKLPKNGPLLIWYFLFHLGSQGVICLFLALCQQLEYVAMRIKNMEAAFLEGLRPSDMRCFKFSPLASTFLCPFPHPFSSHLFFLSSHQLISSSLKKE